MKKLSLGLNIVLIVAVAGIYFLHFSGKSSKVGTNKHKTEKAIDRDYEIAYVNIDSLVAAYDLFIDRKEELTQKKNESEVELQVKSQSFEKEVRDFQTKVSKGLITRTKAQMVQQELAKKEQELYATRDNLAMQLAEEERVMYRQVLNEIMEFLKEYNAEYNYKYIFSNSFGGQLLYTDEALDITEDVLNGLNEAYTKAKK
ncbi:MAG: OmpH family outer membrane protein [Bacteroidales bacterium]|nr:OmpH family outer membrane protein [Bacteroidales bacterium]